MQIGKLRHRLEIQRYDETADAYGEPIKGYEHYADAFCSIRPLNGSEPFNEKQFHTEQTHKIVMRWMRGIESTMRLVWFDDYEGRYRVFELIGNPINYYQNSKMILVNVKELFNHDIPHPIAPIIPPTLTVRADTTWVTADTTQYTADKGA